MESLFGRFPHLVEDIFGLLDGETLFRCSHINKTWNENIDNHQLHLVQKIQKHLKNTSNYADCEKKEGQYSPKILLEKLPIISTLWHVRLCTIEQLPLPILINFQRYFCEHKLKDCKVNHSSVTTRQSDFSIHIQ